MQAPDPLSGTGPESGPDSRVMASTFLFAVGPLPEVRPAPSTYVLLRLRTGRGLAGQGRGMTTASESTAKPSRSSSPASKARLRTTSQPA